MGIATIQANHFAPRGISSTVGNQTRVTGPMMAADALYILNALAKHPKISPDRIGIMGSSKGGHVAWISGWEPLRNAVSGNNKYAAHIAFYPPCGYFEDKTFTHVPMLIMIGDQDNYTGVRQCVESTEQLRRAGYRDLTVKLYPGAYHGFDSDREMWKSSKAYSALGCKFVLRPDGTLYEAHTKLSLDDPKSRRSVIGKCAKKGNVRLGSNQAAMSQAMQDVRAFLAKALSL